MKLLDCTLRDGGYYNKWDFSGELVEHYLAAVSKSGIEYIELGFRNFPQKTYFGPFAYTTERLINRLKLPLGPKYGVMIDAGVVIKRKGSLRENVDHLFCSKSSSKLDFVRIACHFHEVKQGVEIAKILKAKGYIVGFNLMQAGGRSSLDLQSSVELINSSNSVDVLYFADSFGNMKEAEVTRINDELKKQWKGTLGIHTHNNMGRAIQNSLHAKSIGVEWLDCTITGMGRGAGNAESELLVSELSVSEARYSAKPLLDLAISYFDEMKRACGWGMSAPYYLGATKGIHPTYIQTLLQDPHFTPLAMLDFIDQLGAEEKAKYSGDNYEKIKTQVCQVDTGVSGLQCPEGVFPAEMILVGSGSSMAEHINGIEDFIKVTGHKVATVNLIDQLNSNLVDFIFLTKNSKYLVDKVNYKFQDAVLVLPFNRFTNSEIKSNFSSHSIFDYKIKIASDFLASFSSCETPFDLTAVYALSALASRGVKKIYLLGFDGYTDRADVRYIEMSAAFEYFEVNFPGLELVSKLPTQYNLVTGSIYE